MHLSFQNKNIPLTSYILYKNIIYKNIIYEQYNTMLQLQHILQNIVIPDNIMKYVIPFTHHGEFLPCIFTSKRIEIEMYDLYPIAHFIQSRDVLMNPPDYYGKFILSKPPNKDLLETSQLYQKYKQNNVYKCFIDSIIEKKCIGGVIIIPFVFWCSSKQTDKKLRRRFLKKYTIPVMNIFNGVVCDINNLITCSFQFVKRRSICHSPNSPNSPNSPQTTQCHIYPHNYIFDYVFDKNNDYTYIYNNAKQKRKIYINTS